MAFSVELSSHFICSSGKLHSGKFTQMSFRKEGLQAGENLWQKETFEPAV